MFQFLKRYKELLTIGALVMLPLAAFLTYSRTGRSLTLFDQAALWVSRPIQKTTTAVIGFVIYEWEGLFARRVILAENRKLLERVAKLEGEKAELTEVRTENEELRRALGFSRATDSRSVVAQVIGESPAMNLITLKIDQGTNAGISKGMAVVTPEGVVGRVLSAGRNTADVLLLEDSNFAVAVRSQRSRARARVVGQGTRALPSLAQAARTDDFAVGDLLVTAGTDGVFAPGLPVGRIVSLWRPVSGIFQTAQVEAVVDPKRLEKVMVLVTAPLPQTPLQEPPAPP